MSTGSLAKPQSIVPESKHITVVNRCNWRLLKRGRDVVNRAIHAAAGPELEALCHDVRPSLDIGETCTVKLPPSNLYRGEGVKWIINVLAPHMNRALGMLDRMVHNLGAAQSRIHHLQSVNFNDDIQTAFDEMQPALVELSLEMGQSKQLFDALEAMSDDASLNPVQKKVLENQIKSYVKIYIVSKMNHVAFIYNRNSQNHITSS